ncbi:MAG TPA: hypothetical protein VL382_09325, partial [Terriglobales bacterium]|nr:hypothetical protein [Terriglobales bacterium]
MLQDQRLKSPLRHSGHQVRDCERMTGNCSRARHPSSLIETDLKDYEAGVVRVIAHLVGLHFYVGDMVRHLAPRQANCILYGAGT